jgi:UTP-glucose-1-phosphate uridylyltransferase
MLPEGFTLPEGRTKPWGTAHALWVARNAVNEPFVSINADDFYGKEAYQTLAQFISEAPAQTSDDYAICGYRLDKTLSEHGSVTRAICSVDEKGFLQSVDEQFNIQRNANGETESHKDEGIVILNGDAMVSMNIWAFNPSIFPIIENRFREFLTLHIQEAKSEMYIPRLVDELVKNGEVNVKMLQSDAGWFGVTYTEDKPMVLENLDKLYQRNEYPENLWE